MGLLTHLLSSNLLQTTKHLPSTSSTILVSIRYASKYASSSGNKSNHHRPKHRGIRFQDGKYVKEGTMLVRQLQLRFHPGLHVGFAKNGTLYAKESGKVMVTCEKINPNLKHPWIAFHYAGREHEVIYKKHFNIIPEPQHKRFKLIDAI